MTYQKDVRRFLKFKDIYKYECQKLCQKILLFEFMHDYMMVSWLGG